MSCMPSFSSSFLYNSSQETEVILSTHCLPNMLKFWTYLAWLSFYTLSFTFMTILLIVEFKKTPKWNVRTRTLFFLVLSASFETIRLSMLIAGVTSLARYLVYPFSTIFLLLCGIFIVRDWFQTAWLIRRPGNDHHNEDHWSKFDVGFVVLGFYLVVGFLVCWMIGPMATFSHSASTLNWFYILGYTHYALFALALCIYALYIGNELKKLVEPSLSMPNTDSEPIRIFLEKLKTFFNYGRAFLVILPPLLFLPFWMTFTTSPTDPGLPFFFYFEFFVFLLLRSSALVMQAWFALRKAGHSHSHTHHSSQSEKSHPSFPSYNLDELNGKPSSH